ncbi:MAG: right-handed parallel beta-helix repeat-containing protein [Euryarchaeota archaeon]|nr:right-handed parallel beta-helix repeat-containing protein [Euryarchaeota archaeon]
MAMVGGISGKLAAVAVCAMTILSALFVAGQQGHDKVDATTLPAQGANYIAHAPIRINSDAEFDAAHGVTKGSGTQVNPWIIENYDINGTGYGYCIYIGNTTNYFEIKNCSLHNANGVNSFPYYWDTGIICYSIKNGTITNSTIQYNHLLGIYFYICSYCSILNNNLSYNTDYTIYFEYSVNCTIRRNYVFGNSNCGIVIAWSSQYNTVDGNIVKSNGDSGIYMSASGNYNTIVNNDVSLSSFCGINMWSGADYNLIYHNKVYNNPTNGNDYDWTNTWDNGYPSGGNYWDDYGGTDIYSGPLQNQPGGDGIGDTSYGYVADSYPLMKPILNGHIQRPPIRINSNAEFTPERGVSVGDGSQGNPYIIENYDINGTGYGYCIYIGNTTKYFEVRKCNLHEANGVGSFPYYEDSGLTISNVTNGTIADNSVWSNHYNGIFSEHSSNNTINNNSGFFNQSIGINLYFSCDTNLIDNVMAADGIALRGHLLRYWNSHNIDTSNTISGKPVYYWKNQTGGTIPAGAGEIILANCTNVMVESQNISVGDFAIQLGFSSNNTVTNNSVRNSRIGIYMTYSDNNNITNNTLYSNYNGIYLYDSCNYCTIKDNIISQSENHSIYLYSGNYNSFINNKISNNGWGAYFTFGDNNVVFHNNFINNTNQAYDDGNNLWNDSYPSGGNYWSNYTGIDVMSGPLQDIPGADGIGDTPFIIDTDSRDNYPLMSPYNAAPPQAPSFMIPVVAGWNLISSPLIPYSSQLPGALTDRDGDTLWDRVQWYDAFNPSNLWRQYYTGWSPSLSDLNTVNQTMGAWVYVTAVGDGFIKVNGTVANTTSIPLRAGWNLVGYPTLNTTTKVSDALWGTSATVVETFDPAAPYRTKVVSPSYLMKPGEGYWICVPSDTVWTVDW